MNEKYYLFFYDKELKKILKDEIKFKYKDLNLSFSNSEFLSYKGPSNLENQLKKKPIYFAKRQAIFIDKTDEPRHKKNAIEVGKQWWNYKPIYGHHTDTLNLKIEELPELAPARAYLKMQQAHDLFKLDLSPKDQVIEIGSAPGGITYYLLNKNMKVCSIDPAIMDEKFFSNSNFKHLKASIFDIEKKDLPKRCDWVISDLNLEGDLNINQTMRIISLYPELKGAFITIKTPRISELRKVPKWIQEASKGFKVSVVNLPAHRNEVGFILKR